MSTSFYTEAVEAFITSAEGWLSDEDLPAVAALRGAAIALDTEGTSAALLNAYGLMYRSLLKRKPANADAPEDELELLLRDEDAEDA